MTPIPLKVFIIYAHEDHHAVELLRKQLVSLEKNNTIELWHDGKILPGQKWDETIKNRLDDAELLLLCVSVDFINSAYIEDTELKKALDRHRQGLAHLIPVILRSCDWVEYFGIGQFQALPNKARPVYSSHFPYLDEAFYEVQQGIKSVVNNLLEKREAQQRAEADATRLAETRKNYTKRVEQLDEAAWKAALDEMEAATSSPDKMIALETYLDDLAHSRHRDEAEQLLAEIKTADTKRLINEKKQREARKIEGLPEMIFVKGGSFNMGGEFQVMLSDYAIGKYPVTQKLWKEIMGNNPSRFQGDDLPVEQVNWDDCQQFLEKLNERYPGKAYRLPTEAEWEYAARGGTLSKGYEYSGSNDLDEVGWYGENSGSKTHVVGKKKANELGIFDMSGNVWEWCQDWYGNYPSGSVHNWRGPDEGDYRVHRGGSWYYDAQCCRVALRLYGIPSLREYSLGFRLVCLS